jgi:Ni/Fe-hydrogenase subunit HybB-like protein
MRNKPTAAPTSYADRPTTKPPAWHALVAWDMLFNGLSTGLFLTAALGELAAPAVFEAVTDAAYPVALCFLLLDLLFLVLDLGDPWRFHHMLRVFKPSSPMSLGTWSLAAYSLPLSVIVATELLPSEWTAAAWVRKAAVVAGLLPALASAVYKGVLISTNAQPGWRDARWMGAYLTTSAFALGCAEMLALSVLTGHGDAVTALRPGFELLLALNAVVLALLVGNVRIVLARVYSRRKLWLVGTACVGGTVALPMALVPLGGAPVILAAVLSLLLGSLAARFVIVAMPHAPA